MVHLRIKVWVKVYDGDQITVKGCFTQNSNLEAEKILKSKKNILGISGNNVRLSTNETVQTLYMMTKFKED